MRPLLLFTIDVEEDMPDWRITDPITVRNVTALPRLAELCSGLGVRPTYLCTYPVVRDKESAATLRLLHERGDCEIGSHLHPWNTPPFNGVPGRKGDERMVTFYQYELGSEEYREKLQALHDAVSEVAGRAPTSFRAGRFGIDAKTIRALPELGYLVDSSVTPLEEHVSDGGPDFRRAPQVPYRPHVDDVTRAGDLPIVEIPVSVSLTKSVPSILQRAYVHMPKLMRFRGLLSRDFLRVIDFAWLYPARFDFDLMAKAAATLVESGCPVLNVFIHSSEIVAGASGRIRTRDDVEECYSRLQKILSHCIERFDAVPATLTEAAVELRPGLGLEAGVPA